MASSSLTHINRYHQVFPSFHGPDLGREFLSHVQNHFARKGITTFNDQGIERGHTIGPEVVQGIRESKVSIVVLSPKYASSRWCLDELVEIIKCKETSGQMIVVPIFYHVAPSHVRIQSGDFGKAFDKTCEGQTEEVKKRWSNALAHVGSLRGDYSLFWDDDAAMFESIATHVSLILNDKS